MTFCFCSTSDPNTINLSTPSLNKQNKISVLYKNQTVNLSCESTGFYFNHFLSTFCTPSGNRI